MTDPRQRNGLVDFFRRRLLPLGRGIAEPVRPPDDRSGSLYHSRGGQRPRPESLEISLGSPREIAASLEAHWQGTPLSGLGRALLRLSRRFPRREEKSEVSSDIYEMF